MIIILDVWLFLQIHIVLMIINIVKIINEARTKFQIRKEVLAFLRAIKIKMNGGMLWKKIH